jgi:DNA repair protein RecN (Recombination protein N)
MEEVLQEKAKILRSSEKIAAALGEACRALEGSEELPGACDLLSDAAAALDSLRSFPDFSARSEALENLRIELAEQASSLSSSLQSLEFDQGEADAIERRLRQINRLKSRYGGSIEEILEHCRKAKEELEGISSQKETLRAVTAQAREQKEKVSALANELTEARIDAAVRFAHTIEEEAKSLEMPNLRVETSFAPCKLCAIGNHSAELLLSANLGEPPRPIAKIASGGELSRIMLAIKSALADKDDIGTLIFDEIDTGVSGKAAQKIGRKLQKIASHRQVICVTHSAQIAALADHQLLIRKSTSDGRTFTEVLPLEGEQRVAEVARIFSTDHVTDLMLQTARSMIEEGKR